MKHFLTLLYIALVLPLTACSQASSNGSPSQYELALSENEKLTKGVRVAPFNEMDFMKPFEARSSADIPLQHITGKEISNLVNRADYTWVVVWASWCPHCKEGLSQFPADAAKMKNMVDINLVLIAEDYDLPVIQKRIFNSPYRSQAYVLNPTVYTFDEDFKLRKIRKELCADCPEEDGAVPQHYIFNKKGELILHQMGGEVNDIMIMTAIEKYNQN